MVKRCCFFVSNDPYDRAIFTRTLSDVFSVTLCFSVPSGIVALSLMKEEENGHLFSIEKEDEFHGALDRILVDPVHGKRMADNGHRLTAQEFDTAILSRRIKALYEDIIREKA